jgi:hypothetical protein
MEMWSWMCRLTGSPPPYTASDRDMSPISIAHLWDQYPRPGTNICWVLVNKEELVRLGYNGDRGDEQLYLALHPDTIHFQPDCMRSAKQNENPERRRVEPVGQLDPSIHATLADVYPLTGQYGHLAWVSAAYRWRSTYINSIPDRLLRDLFCNRMIPEGAGQTYGNLLDIKVTGGKKFLFHKAGVAADKRALCAAHNPDLVIRPGMGIAFQNTQAPPDVPRLAIMHGYVTAISDESNISVQLVLVPKNLPGPWMNWRLLGPAQGLQTSLVLQIRLEDVLAVERIMPFALYQHGGELRTSRDSPGSVDLVVMGDLSFKAAGDDAPGSGDTLRILDAMHRIGTKSPPAFTLKIQLERVSPFPEQETLNFISNQSKLYGVYYGLGRDSWRHYITTALHGWAMDKTKVVRSTGADNTLHLRIPGCVFVSMLHDLLPWTSNGGTLAMRSAVTARDGVIMVKVPDFGSAADLLGRNTGLFDFTGYEGRLGYVELFAPIVFKWEMYDKGRDSDDSRSPEGFVAITFAYYDVRDIHNSVTLNGTRHTNGSGPTGTQLGKRPSDCPGLR